MHTLALRTLRSASRSPARFIAHRRYPPSARIRHFHPSPTALNSSEGSSDPKDPAASPQNDGAANTEPTPSPDEAAEVAKTEESAEERSQKAKKEGRNGYGSALRRSNRNRIKEIPPVVIPEWFFERNVKLTEDCVRVIPENFVEYNYVIRDVESGEIRARLPILLRRELVENPKFKECLLDLLNVTLLRDGSDGDMEMALKVLNIMERTLFHRNASIIALRELNERFSDGIPKEAFIAFFGHLQDADLGEDVVPNFPNGAKILTQEQIRAMLHYMENKAREEHPPDKDDWEGTRPYPMVVGSYTSTINSDDAIHISFQLATHLRALINALLTPQSSSIYADARSSLILSASNTSYAFFLEGAIQHIASEVGADIITLEAQDFAELGAEYVGDDPEEGLSGLRSLSYSIYKDRLQEQDAEKEQDTTEEEAEDAENADEPGLSSVEAAKPAFHAQFIPLTSTNIQGISKTLERLGALKGPSQRTNGMNGDIFAPAGTRRGPSNEQWDEMKLNALLDALMDTGRTMRAKDKENEDTQSASNHTNDASLPTANAESKGEQPSFSDAYNQFTGIKRAVHAQLTERTKESANTDSPFGQGNASSPLLDTESRSHRPSLRELKQRLHDLQTEVEQMASSMNGIATSASATSGSERFEILNTNVISIALERKLDSRHKQDDVAREPSTIIVVREFKELQSTPQGARIVSKLSDIIQHRRREGERIMLIGTSVHTELPSRDPMDILGAEVVPQEMPYQEIFIPFAGAPAPRPLSARQKQITFTPPGLGQRDGDLSFLERFESAQKASVNFRHVKSMVKSLYPSQAALEDNSHSCGSFFNSLKGSYLSFTDVHDVVTTAMGIARTSSTPNKLMYTHLTLALAVLEASRTFRQAWSEDQTRKISQPLKSSKGPDEQQQEQKTNIDALRKKCNKHERRLLPGVVNASAIKTTFSSVHAAPETIEALKTLTLLSLIRPDAFTYGVLANDKLPGLLLYGPPGTGKTLLAKAVAKDSGATVLEVSGSEIYDMYVGEGEKNVRAIFSLARKLGKSGPCVVFVDEADAIFRSRGRDGRNSQREIINQFLKEWDGMSERSVFIMVATNRPFDLDDAVLRRLPRRLLVDLPTEKDREAILKIHLEGETLAEDVSLSTLASKTPFYSGSDLKNLCVSAALACVRQENEADKTAKAMDVIYHFADKRTLRQEHFDKAMEEISASISEDMESLTAIRKFDEMYGDRRNRRKRGQLGFGDVDEKVAEKAARVRK